MLLPIAVDNGRGRPDRRWHTVLAGAEDAKLLGGPRGRRNNRDSRRAVCTLQSWQVIDKEEFADEFADLAHQAGIEDTCALEFPEYMYERHERSPRSFAEVDPHGLYFAFAPQVLELDWAHRRGLIMHELGHVLCRDLPDGGNERDADKAAERVFGERIIYDSAWPGKGLQCVRCRPNPAAPPGIAENFLAAVIEASANDRWPMKEGVIRDALETIIAGYKRGEIRNALYKESKDTLGRAFDKAWDGLRTPFTRHLGINPESSLSWQFSIMSLHDAISSKKKLDKFKAKPSKGFPRHEEHSLEDVDPRMVAQMETLFDAAYPLALMVKEMKSMTVKGRAPAPPKDPEPVDPRVKTCAVCFGEFVTTKAGRPVRHGFSIVTQGRGYGHLGAWHTGPCMGADYPHYGLSSSGTEAALVMARNQLVNVRGSIEGLEDYPPLGWTYTPPKWEMRKGATPRAITVSHGTPRDPELGAPSYDELHRTMTSQLESENTSLIDSIAFYEKKIATWEYRP